MTTAIIGVGSIGGAVAAGLVAGGEPVVLAATSQASAVTVATQLGDLASAADVDAAVDAAEAVVFAIPFEVARGVLARLGARLDGKVVIDPSNPVALGLDGELSRVVADDVSGASVLAEVLPAHAHLVKAFGTLAAESLRSGANRTPEPAVLFYATDDTAAVPVVRRLIEAAGFDPVGIGGIDQALRIEMGGDLHQFGGLDGRLVSQDEAAALVAGPTAKAAP